MPNYPTSFPSRPVRNLLSMMGRGTGITHPAEHDQLWDELIAIAQALGLRGDQGPLFDTVRNLTFNNSLQAFISNVTVTTAPFLATYAVDSPGLVGLRGQLPTVCIATRESGGNRIVQTIPIAYDSTGTIYQFNLPAAGTWRLLLKVV